MADTARNDRTENTHARANEGNNRPLVDVAKHPAATREAFKAMRANDRIEHPALDYLNQSLQLFNDADQIQAALGPGFDARGHLSPNALHTIAFMMQRHPGEIAELQDQVNQVLKGNFKLNLGVQPDAQYAATGHHGNKFTIASVNQTNSVVESYSVRP